MKENVFRVAMSYLEGELKISSFTEDVSKIKTLVDAVKGVSDNKDFPKITNSDQFYEFAETLGISKSDFHKIMISIFSSKEPNKLPMGLIGDLGEFLGDKHNGIGVLPISWLQRMFFLEDLSKKVGPAKWEYFIKDTKTLKDLKENKGV